MQQSWQRKGMLASVRQQFVNDVRPQDSMTLKELMAPLKVRTCLYCLIPYVYCTLGCEITQR